jgi:hypothetical protein
MHVQTTSLQRLTESFADLSLTGSKPVLKKPSASHQAVAPDLRQLV